MRINFNSLLTHWGHAWSTEPGSVTEEQEHQDTFEEMRRGAEAYLYSVWLATVNRTFFTTNTGHIGMGPRDSTVGDSLCIILGSRVLRVLRPVDDHHAFQGDAYVDGIMKVRAPYYLLHWINGLTISARATMYETCSRQTHSRAGYRLFESSKGSQSTCHPQR